MKTYLSITNDLEGTEQVGDQAPGARGAGAEDTRFFSAERERVKTAKRKEEEIHRCNTFFERAVAWS